MEVIGYCPKCKNMKTLILNIKLEWACELCRTVVEEKDANLYLNDG